VKITRKSNPLFCPSLVRLTFLSASSPAVSMNFWQPELPYFFHLSFRRTAKIHSSLHMRK